MKDAFFIGCLLILLSAWPIILMGIEVFAGDYALKRYHISIFETPETTFGEHTIRVDRNQKPPQITIDGRDYTSPTATEKCLYALLEDRKINQEFVTITHPEPRASYTDLHYRILRVPRIGPVQEEIFHMDDRVPLYRSLLMMRIAPQPMGFYSDVMCCWPSLFYPILYPWLSGIVGLILTLVGGIDLWKRRHLTKRCSERPSVVADLERSAKLLNR